MRVSSRDKCPQCGHAIERKLPKCCALQENTSITIAHQNMFCPELDDNIRGAISTNTSIKYAASPKGMDLNYMARDMCCESDFLEQQQRKGNVANFACYVRGMGLQHPFVYDVELGYIDRWPKMPDDMYARHMLAQRAALQADPNATKPIATPTKGIASESE